MGPISTIFIHSHALELAKSQAEQFGYCPVIFNGNEMIVLPIHQSIPLAAHAESIINFKMNGLRNCTSQARDSVKNGGEV